jgi:hypothetical protein
VQIRVLPSQSKNRLYLGNLPKTISKEELEAQVRAATKGVLPTWSGVFKGLGIWAAANDILVELCLRLELIGLLQAWRV